MVGIVVVVVVVLVDFSSGEAEEESLELELGPAGEAMVEAMTRASDPSEWFLFFLMMGSTK